MACRLVGAMPSSEPMLRNSQLDDKQQIQHLLFETEKILFSPMPLVIIIFKILIFLRPQSVEDTSVRL